MRERYAPLAVTSFTREVTAPDFDGPFMEQFGYTQDFMYLPDEWLPVGTYETAEVVRRIGDLMVNIDGFLNDTYDSRGLAHRLLGHGDSIQGGVESDWQRAPQRPAGHTLPGQESSRVIGGCCCRSIRM